MKYRPEIDGLRAIAVIPVILFHAGFQIFSGGYVGVDIFFVISGYLITSILLKELEQGDFSILRFYERRAKRILPALVAVSLAILIFGYFFTLPFKLEEISKTIIAVGLFASNIFFWTEVNYFARSAEENPLLHTWSLAIEEQFYLIFPIFLLLIWRLRKQWALWLIILGALSSFATAEYGWRFNPVANFYLTPTRAWELLIGCICAFILHKKQFSGNNLLALVGFISIILSIFLYDKTTPFPSFYTLLPVIGTALIILYAKSDTAISKFLSLKALVAIGLISYSAYLWHQPIFAFSRILSSNHLSYLTIILLIILTFIFSGLSWKYIEQPFRSKQYRLTQRSTLMLSITSLLFLICLGTVGYYSKGALHRFDAEDQYLASLSYVEEGKYVDKRFNILSEQSFPEKNGQQNVLIIGDSYAKDFVNMIYENSYERNVNIVTYTIPGNCGNLYTSRDISQFQSHDCYLYPGYEDKKLIELTKKADYIFLVSSWAQWHLPYLQETYDNLDAITEADIVLATTKGFGQINPQELLYMPKTKRTGFRQKVPDSVNKTNEFIRKLDIPYILDIPKFICDSTNSCPIFDTENRLISYDGGHLTRHGALYVGDKLRQSPIMIDAFNLVP
ncbi:acyltransferase family protein [Curvivirga aplysinae]|uniref:acyltransferase family protein n=1 Tax=Curvivirga aplysinae TaxID=2529852 RepID=UPI0012BD7054|nr:acyltransferase family protein [Curvivirga aplysinae]MTI08981.1 acyltransferase [Curvivirga aplysinae]